MDRESEKVNKEIDLIEKSGEEALGMSQFDIGDSTGPQDLNSLLNKSLQFEEFDPNEEVE